MEAIVRACSFRRAAQGLARLAIVAIACLVPAIVPTSGLAQSTGTAVEYYHAGFDHYFITAYPHEIDLLDTGGLGGAWSRTGQAFPVWTEPAPGTSEACRFFGVFGLKSSHFYTPIASECTDRKNDPVWGYEAVAFHVQTAPIGTCSGGASPLYRLYNNGLSGAPNHRYTTSRATFEQMQAQGWTAEGAGSQIVFAWKRSVRHGARGVEGVSSNTAAPGSAARNRSTARSASHTGEPGVFSQLFSW